MNRLFRGSAEGETEKLVQDLQKVVVDSRALLAEVGNQSAEGFSTARSRFEGKLRESQEILRSARDAIKHKSDHAAQTTQDYVEAHPWKALGAVGAAGVVVGLLMTTRRHH